jgi:hypothetical protein
MRISEMRNSIGLLGLIVVLGLTAAPANAVMLTIVPESPTVNLGGTFSVDVVAAGLLGGSAPSIGTYDLNVGYDASLLSLANVTFGNGLDVLGLGSLRDASASTAGLANVFELSFDSIANLDLLQPDTFKLFTLTFNANSIGTSVFGLTINALGDSAGNSLSADTTGASVSVTPVPLPPTPWLLLSGFGVASAFFRRKQLSAR